jgi:hypothetical protein
METAIWRWRYGDGDMETVKWRRRRRGDIAGEAGTVGKTIEGTNGRTETTRSQGICREIINNEGIQRREGSEKTPVRTDDEVRDGEILNSKVTGSKATDSKVIDSKVTGSEVIGSKVIGSNELTLG